MTPLMMASGPSPHSSTSSPSLEYTPIKKEAPDDEIKEFAETAMNELLGWYGYETRGGPPGPRGPLGPRAASPSSTGQPPACTSPSENSDECSWCKNPISPETNALSQSVGDRYCSELCFSQSRRATFKRAKTCDWCRHVRHTVSYVDFQDGATQLQFCSDKCLNQYKMHIFCRETQAHLDLNPHLVNVTSSSTTSLITPDLWMKNCKSRSVSPSSDRSASPAADSAPSINPPASPKSNAVAGTPEPTSTQTKPQLPVISVTPSSKLMKSKPTEERQQSHHESRREHRIMKANAKKRRSSRCTSTVTSQTMQKHGSATTCPKPQDLRVSSPPLSHEGSPNSTSHLSTPQNVVQSPPCMLNPRIPNLHPPNFPNPILGLHPPPFFGGNHGNFPEPRMMRPPFFPPPNFMPRHPLFSQEHLGPPFPPPPQLGVGTPPPVTILVPYPVILPIPLPIPIPIPILEFSKAIDPKKWFNEQKRHHKLIIDDDNCEEPLDCTVTPKKPRSESPPPPELNKEPAITKESKSDELDTTPEKCSKYSGTLECVESSNPEQTLPRFKITRLGAKLSKVVPKNRECPESTRPLRKRNRIVPVQTDEDSNPVVSKTRKPVQV